MQGRNEDNSENPPILRTDSSTTTSKVNFKNRLTQQTTKKEKIIDQQAAVTFMNLTPI